MVQHEATPVVSKQRNGATPKRQRRPRQQIQPALVSKTQGADFLNISVRMFDQLEKRGDISRVPIPGVRRSPYDLDELRALVERWKSQRGA